MLMAFYNTKLDGLYKELDAKEAGLSSEEAAKRIEKYGRNSIVEEKLAPWWKMLLAQFNSPVVWVLLGAVVVSLFVGEVVDAVVVAVILVLNSVLGFYQDFRAEKSIEALKKMASLKAVVIRDGVETKIDAFELVSGDIILLETGEKVPADARIIQSMNLETQEAALTGESTPVCKDAKELEKELALGDRHNMVFSSTIITKGHGKALVCATGMRTEIGRIAHLIQTTKTDDTPLQKQLANLGKWLGIIVVAICAVVFLVGYFLHEGTPLDLFIAAVALAVAAIPEGLPAVVTISLSLGVQRMVKRNALMRHLPSVETLGCTTVICTDKTGTLTRNEMTVRRLFVNWNDVKVDGAGYRPEGGFSEDKSGFEMLLKIGALNNDAKLDREHWTVIGDPTEACLITSALKAGIDKHALDEKHPRIDEIPFDSSRKRMTTIHEVDGKRVAYVKGAADLLLKQCGRILVNDKVKVLTPKDKEAILKKSDEYAKEALRVLGFAYKEIRKDDKKEDFEEDLVFVGLQAMIDPPRDEVKGAIAKCRDAGIKVVMITGDFKTTAEAIAKELGIKGKALTGEELERISDEELSRMVNDIAIYARVNPEQKMKIITALKSQGHVVAMTGDGVNDAPAIKKADIGISMGIMGTDVAKEASEMILTDDNFTSIVNAVEEGRGIYDNIRKFVNYLLSCNIGEVLVIFIASIIGLPLPLIAVQILWMNLVTDGLPAIALGVDPVSEFVMKREPRKVGEKVLSKGMFMNVFFTGALICITTLLMYYLALPRGVDFARTVAFTTLVMLEMARLHIVRSVYHTRLFSNKYLTGAVLSSVVLQLIVIYTPLSIFFKTVPLDLIQWVYILFAALVVFGIGLFAARIIRKASHEMY
jgi:Ca2+-transporting ATPase